MKTNEFLYGKDIEVPQIPQEIIMRRIELLNDHLAELLEVDFMERDASRYNKVIEAIDFWESINDR